MQEKYFSSTANYANKNNRGGDKRRNQKDTRPRQRRRRRMIIGAAVLAVAVGGVCAFTNSPNGNPISDVIKVFKPLGETNILLIGNNARNPKGPLDIGQGGGQADIMMLAHINPKQHSIELVSIPRDMLFAMPQYNISIPKIKSLFFLGAQMTPNQAAQLTVDGVQKFTGMHIDYWVTADFQGFSDAIDAVGGVRVDIPGRIYDPAHSGANLFPGWQTLNGQQALAYIRVRQNTASSVETNDFERDNAQAQVLGALQQKLLNKSNDMGHIGSLIKTWDKDVATNMSMDDLLRVAHAVQGAKVSHMNLANVGDSMDVMGASVPGINRQNYVTGAFYDIIDPSQITQALKPYGSTGAWTGIPLPPPSQIPVDVYASAAYVDKLKSAGYNVTATGGSNGTYPVQIDYPSGDLAWGLSVGRTLATGNSEVRQGSTSNAVVVYGP